MRKILIMVGIMAIAGVSWLVRKSAERHTTESAADPLPQTDLTHTKAAQSRSIKLRLLEKAQQRIPALRQKFQETDCQSLWIVIENFPFAEMNKADAELDIPALPVCTRIPAGILPAHEALTSQCRDLAGKKKSEIRSEEQNHYNTCLSLLLTYRGSIHDWATQNVDVATCTDLALLMDKLMAAAGRSDAAQLEKVASRMHELEPNFYEPVKALVISKLISVFQYDEGKERSEALLLLERSLDDARSFDIYDPELLQAELLLKTRGFQDLDALEASGKQVSLDYPDKGFGDYAVSAARFHKKDLDGVRSYLKSALTKEPQNEQFRATLKALEQDPQNFDRKIFTIALGFHIDFNEDNEVVLKRH